MNKISVKMSDISLRGTDGAKSTGQTREVTDDFKKLLQGQKDDGKDVSKDTKTENKPEDVKEEKKEEPVKTDNAMRTLRQRKRFRQKGCSLRTR